MPNYSHGSEVKEWVKRLLEALLSYVNYEFDDCIELSFNWPTENQLVVRTTLTSLSELTQKDKYEGKLDKPQIREALRYYLKEFLQILQDNRTATQGSEQWHFTLKLRSKNKQENLSEFDKLWEQKRKEKSKASAASPKSKGINWREICGKVLAKQRKKQLFRRSITGRGLGHEANKVYVKLGLVKPREQPQRGEDSQPSAEKGMLQYRLTEKEIEQEYKYDEFLEQVIEKKGKNFVIVGEPGAGKSTWLEQISQYVEQSEKDFPICISLASLAGKTLEDYLLQIWLEDALPFISPNAFEVTPALQNKLKELFNSGQAWLLLDGVDEMRIEGYEAPLQTISNQLRGWGDLARVVLTCRSNVWEANPNVLPNFETYRTLHFDDNQVAVFIEQWFTQEGKPELGEKLQNKLGESGNERIRDLIKNPLRLAMLCGIWYFHQGDLPKTKAALYQRYIDYFYQWKPHPLLTDDLDKQEELHTAFSKLALEAIDNKLPLRKKFVHKVMGQSLFQLARDVGWLNWVYKDAETGEDVYAFFHFTFQEYFAACGIEDWDYFLPREHKDRPVEDTENPEKYKPYRIFEPQWKEVMLLWLGRKEDDNFEKQKDVFIETLIKFEDGCGDFYKYRAYFLAAMGIAEFKDSSFADEIITQMVEWLIEVPRYGCFGEEIRAAIQETDTRRVIEQLISLLDDSTSKNKRHDIIEYLVDIGVNDSKVIDSFKKIIDSPTEKSCCRKRAAYYLGKFGYINLKNQCIAILINILNLNQSRYYTDLSVVEYLEEIGREDQDVIEALAKKLRLINPDNLISQTHRWRIASALVKITPRSNVIYHEATNILTKTEHPIVNLKINEKDTIINYLHELGLNEVNDENLASKVIDIIKHLNHLLNTNQAQKNSQIVSLCLEVIVFEQHSRTENYLKDMNLVIKGFKDCTKEQIRENSKVILHCAQNMPYPDFYQAWHQTTIQ